MQTLPPANATVNIGNRDVYSFVDYDNALRTSMLVVINGTHEHLGVQIPNNTNKRGLIKTIKYGYKYRATISNAFSSNSPDQPTDPAGWNY